MTPPDRPPTLNRKGTFAHGLLPVAAAYVPLARRRIMLWVGLGLGLVFAAYAAFDAGRADPVLLSSGDLSSAHAGLGAQCAACHEPGRGATDARCIECHDPELAPEPVLASSATGADELGAAATAPPFSSWSVDAHAARYGNPHRAVVAEATCSECHHEHRGRGHDLAATADTGCRSCHDLDRFAEHPQFAALDQAESPAPATAQPPAAALAFTHVFHSEELVRSDRAGDAAATCGLCHVPQPGARGFAPLDFEAHCSSCHLGAAKSTEWLGLASALQAQDDAGAEGDFGVRSFAELRRALGPRWAEELHGGDFDERRGRVRKRGLEHPDPWVVQNLAFLRSQVYATTPLADLVPVAGDEDETDPRRLYRQAIAELEERARRLERSAADAATRDEARQVEALLAAARRRLEESSQQLDPEAFAVRDRMPLSDAGRARLDETVQALAGECLVCHRLERLALVRVEPDLARFERAAFDHEAHRLQADCASCHDRIPELVDLLAGESVDAEAAAAGSDRAETINLPGVARCQECHRADEASDSCTTCHGYHPLSLGSVTPRVAGRASRSGGASWSSGGAP
ncbi:MAG: hypothetical protein DWQ36_20845 [Acidobacteria bacterium]|nr:MAG: hypothetical protein DWQ30_21275 [Acidobacteriota bacterium]REK03313.1 MAG: hypothetical protein DWQ36_20845 [Acidobacteriota bacterium]